MVSTLVAMGLAAGAARKGCPPRRRASDPRAAPGGRAVAARALSPQEHQPRAHPLPYRQCLRPYLAAGIYAVTHARLYFTLLRPRPPLYPTQPGEGDGPAARPAYGECGQLLPAARSGPARSGPAPQRRYRRARR